MICARPHPDYGVDGDATMLLGTLIACSSTPFVYPPTALHTVDLSPPEEGEGTIGVGTTAFVSAESIFPDYFGGFADGGLAIGLPKDLDVGLRAFALADVAGGNASLGWTPLHTDTWEGGLALGFGASNHHWAGSTEEEQADGTTVVTDTWDYTYWSLAPSLALRQAWKPRPWLRVPASIRYAHSFAAGMVGDAPSGEYYIEYFDVVGGPELIAGPVRFGLDVGMLVAYNPTTATLAPYSSPRVGMSVQVVLPLYGEPAARLGARP